MPMDTAKPTPRSEAITARYLDFLDKHIAALVDGAETDMLHIRDIARELCIDHGHLGNTVKQTTGRHPCYFFDMKIIEKAKELLLHTSLSASEIARRLTYDPSNFNKFFKKNTGISPAAYRQKYAP